MAELSWDGQRDAGRVPLDARRARPRAVGALLARLEAEGRAALAGGGRRRRRGCGPSAASTCATSAPTTALAVAEPAEERPGRAPSRAEHARASATRGRGARVEVVTARVRVRAPERRAGAAGCRAAARAPRRAPRRAARSREALVRRRRPRARRRSSRARTSRPGASSPGPALVLEDDGHARRSIRAFARASRASGVLVLRDDAPARGRAATGAPRDDPVRLEVARQPLHVDRRADGRGAPPHRGLDEHQGAARLLVRGLRRRGRARRERAAHPGAPRRDGRDGARAARGVSPTSRPATCSSTNDPVAGGSHLPDVTVVTPVFATGARARASSSRAAATTPTSAARTPGSMPPTRAALDEEGVLIPPQRAGARRAASTRRELRERSSRRALPGAQPGRQPRRPRGDDRGEPGGRGAARARSWPSRAWRSVAASMAAAPARRRQRRSRREIAKLPRRRAPLRGRLDDGTPICVRVAHRGASACDIDFAGTGAASPGNLNAPRAVVQAAVLYVLRALVARAHPAERRLPRARRDLRCPPGSLLDPPPGRAVVGGNVETSQRVVDVLLGALGLAAASQGTMNNVAFGDERFGYYETIGGGAGAGPDFAGRLRRAHAHDQHAHHRPRGARGALSRCGCSRSRCAAARGARGAGAAATASCAATSFLDAGDACRSSRSAARRRPSASQGGAPGAPGRNRVVRADGGGEAAAGHADPRARARRRALDRDARRRRLRRAVACFGVAG